MNFRMKRPAWAIVGVSSLLLLPPARVSGDNMVRLSGHSRSSRLLGARSLGPSSAAEKMKLAVALKSRDPEGLKDFIERVHDPEDPLYGRYLTPAEFAERFGASSDDVEKLSRHLERRGMRVKNVHPNRLVLDVEGATSDVESAFEVQMHDYQLKNGRIAHAANLEPNVPAEFAGKVQAVLGLSSVNERVPHLRKRKGNAFTPAAVAPRVGLEDLMTPANIKKTYNLNSVTQTGAGETLALFELDGYDPADITSYATHFGITAPTLQNILVGGYDGHSGDGAIEVTLDIQLAAAMAPGLSKILVYEGPNTDSGVIDTYSRIANDNLAGTVSISWGLSEDETPASILNAENTIFQQMAAQGQSVFAASGDSGAYDHSRNPDLLAVDDPASQPYVTGVGGTKVFWTASGAYSSESVWADSNGGGGGGGVSKVWNIPSWQQAVGTSGNGHSSTKRMVPDVALDADPATGYPIVFQGRWGYVGGTSCGAPLWASYAALVNQKRVADGNSRLGFANPKLYQVGRSAEYHNAFHDIADYKKNFYYPAAVNYDVATGWGSFNGAGLFAQLTAPALPAILAAPSIPATLTARAK